MDLKLVNSKVGRINEEIKIGRKREREIMK